MKKYRINKNTVLILLASIISAGLLIWLFSDGIKSREERLSANKHTSQIITGVNKSTSKKIRKVTYYLENSESMFGYVNGFTEYVDVVSEVAEKPQFVQENTIREFYFINGAGTNIRKTHLGNNPSALKNKLNTKGFDIGDITKSDLNTMFQGALDNAGGDSISIIISDCIYDIGEPGAPFNALATEGRGTRSIFIKRLSNENIQTIIIKLHSKFKGDYFPTSKRGKIWIEQQRPYYILIFGDYELMNKYFTEEYISKLSGFDAMARFFKTDKFNIPYQATAENLKGNFKFDKKTENKLIDVIQDRHGEGFQFTIATDFSTLPISNAYLQTKENYNSTPASYSVTDIKAPTKKMFGLGFTPSHLITVYTPKNPYGKLEISLNNITPSWIKDTNTEDESDIKNDTTHTFGFRFLTNAISEAYEHINQGKNIATFKFELTK